jgi:hypothetical protein
VRGFGPNSVYTNDSISHHWERHASRVLAQPFASASTGDFQIRPLFYPPVSHWTDSLTNAGARRVFRCAAGRLVIGYAVRSRLKARCRLTSDRIDVFSSGKSGNGASSRSRSHITLPSTRLGRGIGDRSATVRAALLKAFSFTLSAFAGVVRRASWVRSVSDVLRTSAID